MRRIRCTVRLPGSRSSQEVGRRCGKQRRAARGLGIQYNDEGSLDLYLQHESPGPELESNWLPTPAGGSRPTLRMYQPGEGVFDGSWLPPLIKRLD
jgi:hypothetical protein